MRQEVFVKADELSRDLRISKPMAYKLIKEMNEELSKKGFLVIRGRVSRTYYNERFYGSGDRRS